MRISGFEIFGLTNKYIGSIQSEIAEKQIQMSSGKQFSRVSDDPARVNKSFLINNAKNQIDQYQRNISDVQIINGVVDTALGSTIDALQIARETGLKAATGTYSNSDKQVFADTIEDLIQQIVSLANSENSGRFIFSGEKSDQPTFTYNGVAATYNGDGNVVKVNVSSQSNMDTAPLGNAAFQQTLNTLITLRDEIRSGSEPTISAALGQLDASLDQVTEIRSNFGVKSNTMDTLNTAYEQRKTNLDTQKTLVEDVDFTKVVSELSLLQYQYQGSVQASLKMLQNSILNYI
jgi:flagellar hook-associated protein 3 FlgL